MLSSLTPTLHECISFICKALSSSNIKPLRNNNNNNALSQQLHTLAVIKPWQNLKCNACMVDLKIALLIYK